MALRKAKAVGIKPVGVSDALDGTNTFKGAMKALSNLIPDPSTAGIFMPRPAAVSLTDFSGLSSPGFISCSFVVGDINYGMIASAKNAGKDEPFAYNILTNTFITITGVTSSNSPTSPPTTGAWTPPTMALISTFVIVTHPGFNGTTDMIGWLDISNPLAPVWHAGNTTTTTLPSIPTAVFNFSGRAYYAVANSLYYSDVLVPLTITNATNTITLGDSTPIIGMGGLPIATTSGGILQSMMVFKAATIFQISGDLAESDLTSNAIDSGVGTSAPLSIVPTPKGLAFVASDGLRLINLIGNVTDPIGHDGSGVSLPFIYTQVPSRICAAFVPDVLRISTINANNTTAVNQEWWFHTALPAGENQVGVWSGPHNFPASLIQTWRNTFVMSAMGINAQLWKSDVVADNQSVYIENGNQLNFSYQGVLSPTTGTMNQNQVVESTIGIAFTANGGAVTFIAEDENGNILDTVFTNFSVILSLWGTMIWGLDLWGGDSINIQLQQIRIPWSVPLVFGQMTVTISGNCIAGLEIGDLWMRYQVTGYVK